MELKKQDTYNSITMLRPGGIGDVVFSIPSLRAIRRAHPEAKIHLIAHIEMANLLKEANLIDTAHSQGTVNMKANEYDGALEVIGRIGLYYGTQWKTKAKELLGNPDLLFHFSPEPIAASYALEQIGVSRFIVEDWHPPIHIHQAEQMMLGLRNAGIMSKVTNETIKFNVEKPNLSYLNNKTVLLAPSSGFEWKCWPMMKWIELSKKLQALGYKVVVLQGPGEHYENRFNSYVWSESLKKTVGLLEKGYIFIGHDSGLTHLSAIVGSPTICLMGPTDPASFAPIGPDVHIIRHCKAESTGAMRICNDPQCMENIPVNWVLSEFIDLSGVKKEPIGK